MWQTKILEKVKEAGGSGFKVAAKDIAGYPDLLVGMPGHPATLIEVKLGVLQVAELQKRIIRELREGGLHCIALCIMAHGNDIRAIRFNYVSGEAEKEVAFRDVVNAIWDSSVVPFPRSSSNASKVR